MSVAQKNIDISFALRCILRTFQLVIQKNLKLKFFAILGAIHIFSVHAQIQYPGKPVSLNLYPVKEVPVITPECYQPDKAGSNDKPGESRLKINKSVVLCDIFSDIHNTGQWYTLPDGSSLWRTGVYVRNAISLSLVFSKFRLEKGARLFVYDAGQNEVLGAYTYHNNKESGIFAVSAIHSELIYIELQSMPFCKNPGELEMGYVAVDYRRTKSTEAVQDTFYKMSGYCNVDINCESDTEIQKVKYSVVRVVYDGVERCTGTLMNTTRADGYPFVLTAGHCIDNQMRANTALFYFDYESPECDGPDGSTAFSIAGSNLLATTDNKLDFSLLELSEQIPFYYHPFFAGWDIRNDAPDGSYTIHHPQGDVKKIAREEHLAETSNYGEGYDVNTHWRILHWEVGTTEKGSSGCPLFNLDNRIVGTLTGGSAMCGYSVDDFFQKIHHCWSDYPNSANQLKYWLDPMYTNRDYIDGYDPFSGFWASGDTLTNIIEGSVIRLYSYRLDWGYNSGHNSDSIRLFAEQFNIASESEILGLFLNIGSLHAGSENAKITLYIWDEELLPENILYSKDILLSDMSSNEDFLVEFDSSISVSEEFYIGFEVSYESSEDTFALNMNLNNDNNAKNTAFVNHDEEWQLLTDYLGMYQNASFDIRPIIFDSIPEDPRTDIYPPENEIFIFPVPASDKVNIMFWELPRFDVRIDLYNIEGKLIKSELYKSPSLILEYYFNKISPGMYILKLNVNNFIITKKFIVLSER